MRRLLMALVMLGLLLIPVAAEQWTAPTVPDDAQMYMPEDTQSFADGLWYIIKSAFSSLRPDLVEGARVCLNVICCVILTSMASHIGLKNETIAELTGVILIGVVLLQPSNVLIRTGVDTISQLSEYGKLLIPVMTAALAAQGGVSSSTALYAGTVFFNTILSNIITNVIVPLLYIFLCISVAYQVTQDDLLKSIHKFLKWAATWCLKTILYVFLGYISITGVVSGTTDAATLKAAKLAISGAVPVVGGILSDASEAVLVSASVMKNAAGIYGLFAVISICIGPFLQIAVPYLLFKFTGSISNSFAGKRCAGLIEDFSAAMGLVLAMVGTMCILLIISIVCFMKGIN